MECMGEKMVLNLEDFLFSSLHQSFQMSVDLFRSNFWRVSEISGEPEGDMFRKDLMKLIGIHCQSLT